eukprot:TRINITY_DN18620_c0_g1_i1.p1 TRINITY_DN18620_c0_g1~~TRINITY_DN18620_c0_g1_i1.p1  ORF type:complete len:450 (+),score=84.57 TRINITY_DN18620_c0_g1_i1:67-1416(+)
MLRLSSRLSARRAAPGLLFQRVPPTIRCQPLVTVCRPRHSIDPPPTQHRCHFTGSGAKDEEESPEAEATLTKVTMWGMYSNLGLSGVKAATGVYTGSAALVADAGHSLSDLFSDFVTLWAVKVARKPADEVHPYGYGKFETIGALTVSGVLVLTAAGLCQHSGSLLLETLNGPLYNPAIQPITMGPLALAGAAAGIGVKEWLYQITYKAGKEFRSSVLIANAWHHRSDALSSIVAVVGIGGTLAGVPLLDPLGGVIVSGMIGKVAYDIGKEAVHELSDQAVDVDLVSSVRAAALDSSQDVLDVHDLRARKMGPYTLVDLHMVVNSRLSVTAAGQAAARLRRHVRKEIPEVNEVLVHIDTYPRKTYHGKSPRSDPAELRPHSEIEADVRAAIATQVPEISGVTHVTCHYEEGLVSVTTELMVGDGLTVLAAKQIAGKGRAAILTLSLIHI